MTTTRHWGNTQIAKFSEGVSGTRKEAVMESTGNLVLLKVGR